MNKSQTMALAGFILLGALVVWQYRRISEMEDAIAATRQPAAAERSIAQPVGSETSGGASVPDKADPGSPAGAVPPGPGVT